MPAEALAGRVNIKTYSAMANPGFHGLIDGGYGFVDLGDGPQEQISGRLSWADDMFGITLAGSHMKFEQQTDNSRPRYDATGLTKLSTAKSNLKHKINTMSDQMKLLQAQAH